jgi:acetylcholinesterase
MLSTDAQFREYVKTYFLPRAPDSELAPLWSAYPDDPRAGSPFDTGILWGFRQYKRIAAFQGDSVFQAPRRFFLQERSGKQKAWSYCEFLLPPSLGPLKRLLESL